MRTPDELIPPLTKAEESYVTEIELRVEEALAKHHRFNANMNVWTDSETGRTIPRAVWEGVVADARTAEWEANLNGSMVSIRRA
jgi:hypothetical protein